MILDERDILKLFSRSVYEFGGGSPSPPPPPPPPPPVGDEEVKQREKSLKRAAVRKRGRQSLIRTGHGARGDVSMAPVFGASLTGSTPESQTLGG